ASEDLILHGEELTFKSATLNGKSLGEGDYEVLKEGLLIKNAPENFELVIQNEINPEANKALDGLYKSGDIFCTQNEPEGFRRITYYLDRPDVMAKFTTKIIADKASFPVLLSNGNPVDQGDLEGGKHFMTWEDPFPKPAYLYALVAGDLGLVQDSYKTMNGRTIDLRIYCDKGNEPRCDHAMESLKKSMKWDEETFGLEYDLDIYMIVAVDSFNMGAMENKGLNIFNSVYVLADKETATDDNFLGIESVVGHEYFHNWTGNRITCRDWFQLTLKEGLTVYRDQEFSSDLNSRIVQRIGDVIRLRSFQYVEDGGPTSHPIKPNSYIEINNFYTATIYEKGAEVIRMVRTFLGKEGFRKGMDKYFELYDGQAVTTEDFLHSMSVANNDFDFTQFKNWYNQSGTPEVNVSWEAAGENLKLTVKQHCPPTPGQPTKAPFHFPLALGILDKDGKEVTLKLQGSGQTDLSKGYLHITKEEETFTFENVPSGALPSLNRGFSAPIKVHAPYNQKDFFFMMANDSDLFNRYEAAQRASTQVMLDMKNKGVNEIPSDYLHAFGEMIAESKAEPAVKAILLSIPSLTLLSQEERPIDYKTLNIVRSKLIKEIAQKYKTELITLYQNSDTGTDYKLDPESIGKRSLRTTALNLLTKIEGDNEVVELAKSHFASATNMTEELSGLKALSGIGGEAFDTASNSFYTKWKDETLVMQKWLTVCGASSNDETFERIQKLAEDDVFDLAVPNLVRSLYGSFIKNYVQFHHESGRGYQYMKEILLKVDKLNPQVASRLASGFKDYKKLVPKQKELMGVELNAILEKDDLSKNVYEIVSKIVKD
ncbi:MAG: aminopeptidase N, partial [Halobacteriovoraceae bacterium]|nr:aminopeptidase N [Halobacteriovoraceae bacterium]